MQFAVPMVDVSQLTMSTVAISHRLQYACIPSDIQPVPHSVDMPIPEPPKKYEIVKNYVEEEEFIRDGTSYDSDFEAENLKKPRSLN
ncbi:hypothetical protein TNCV_4742281 [Trichonephila clavipes]|nr:hypothetical protein TNCV_4742281 [Trichonephila clavipes]